MSKSINFKTLFPILQKHSSIPYADALKLVYALKGWKVLSDTGEIQNDALKFDTFFNNKIELKKFLSVFKKLSKQHKVFSLFLKESTKLEKIDDNSLASFSGIASEMEFPKVVDVFYDDKIVKDYVVSKQIAQFGLTLLNIDNPSIYVPFTNGLTYAGGTDKNFYAESTISSDAFIAELINILDDGDIEFHVSDPLNNPTFTNPNAPHQLMEFDGVLSFPPFGLKRAVDIAKDKFHRFHFQKGIRLEVAYFEHILSQTKKRAVVLMPVGFTYKPGAELDFRRYLVEENILEGIVQLPPSLHNATAIESTFFIIDKEKKDNKVFFYDLRFDEFLERSGRKVTLKGGNNLAEMYTRICHDKEFPSTHFSKFVDVQEIVDNNYTLAIDRYVIPKEIQENIDLLMHDNGTFYDLVKLRELASVKRSQLFVDEGEGMEVYEISPSDFSEAGFTMERGKKKQIKKQMKKYETYKLEPYDILLSTKGTIGKVAIIGNIAKPMIASQAIHVIRCSDYQFVDDDPEILLYMYLKSDIGQALLKQLVLGTAMPQISTSELKDLDVPIFKYAGITKDTIDRFHKEIKLTEKIKQLKSEIKEIHNDYLGVKQ